MYVKALAILLLLSGLIAGCWKLYDAGGDAREDKIIREHQAELLRVTKELGQLRQKAETEIVKDRIVYRDRIQKIREVVHQCDLPADLIGLLRESGVFSR